MIPGTFSHPLFLWPALGLAAFAQTLPEPANAAVFGLAIIGLTGYVGATILSISALASRSSKSSPRPATPRP